MSNVRFEFEYVDKEYDDKTDVRVFKVEATVTYETDKNYGADADGRRGMSMTFIDKVDYDSIVEIMEDGTEIPHDYDSLSNALQKEIDDRINEAEPDEPEPRDYDPCDEWEKSQPDISIFD